MGGVSSRQPYWVAAERWSDAKLNAIAAELSRNTLASPSRCSREERERFREFIFNISMSCLPEASLNYYWPDLHREVSKRIPDGERHPPEHELTKFGRDLFELTDQVSLEKLRAQGIHHCFLALILEQAGIGKDRNRIIYQFLSWLVAARFSLGIGEDAEWPTKAVRTFMRSQPDASSHDIALLGSVLARIGAELIALVTAIERRPDRVEIIGWSWNQLREWWLAETASDLDALTPSAATILLGWISKLSSVWKRSEIFRLSRTGKVDCRWPDGSSASSYEGSIELPLGVAKLRVGDVTQDAVIIDTHGLDLAAIVNLDRDTWLSTDDTYHCKTSDKPFAENHPDYGWVRSVPVFVGAWDRTPHIHYWGRRSKEYRPTVAATLRVPVSFKWRYDKLVAILGGVRTSVEDGDGFHLRIGTQEIWSGEVRNGYLSGWTSRLFSLDRLLAANETELTISLLRDDIIVAQRTIPVWPLQEAAFLVCGTTVCSASAPIVRWVEAGSEGWRTTLLARAPAVEILLRDVSEISRSNVSIHGLSYVAMKLVPALGAQAFVQVGRQQWNIEYRSRPSFSYPPDQEVKRGNISFVGAGNIRTIDRVEDAILSCDSPFRDSTLGFWIAAEEMECFCKLEGETAEINLGRMAELNGVTVRSGELKATLGTPSSQGNISFNFYIPPQQPAIEPSQLGKPSRINLSTKLMPSYWESDLPISLTDAIESKFCSATVRRERWEVTARWKPDVVDLIVGGKVGADCQYQYKVFAQECLPTEVLCQPILTRRGSATILFSGSEINIEAGETCDLLPLILSAMAQERRASAPLAARSNDVQIEWVVDASPSVRNLVAKIVSEVNGLLQIDVNMQVASLFPTELQLSIGDQDVSIKRFWTAAEFEESFSFSVPARRVGDATGSLEVRVTSDHEPIHISTLNVAPVTLCPPIGESLKQLVIAYRETQSAPYLTEILLAYIYNFEEACRAYSPKSIAGKVGIGTNPESETSLRLSLRMLTEMSSGSEGYQALPSPLGVDPMLSALTSSTWLLLARRLAVAGLLDPVDFSRATSSARLAHSASDERARNFSLLAYRFARRVAEEEEISTGINWLNFDMPAIDSGTDFHTPIGRLSTDVETWLGTDQ